MTFFDAFNETLWDLIDEHPCTENPTVKKILRESRATGFWNPVTPARWATFKRRVNSLDSSVPWRAPMLELIARIDRGEFSRRGSGEYRYTTNRKGYGNVSVAGSMFSMINQSANYGKNHST